MLLKEIISIEYANIPFLSFARKIKTKGNENFFVYTDLNRPCSPGEKDFGEICNVISISLFVLDRKRDFYPILSVYLGYKDNYYFTVEEEISKHISLCY
jgi:hypothetical protein